jgi:hypothetical protein
MARRNKKKQLQKSPNRDIRTVPARELAARPAGESGAPRVGYPTALDLIAAPQWREFLQGALRSVLRPAALAGAVGLAGIGAGCGGDGIVPSVASLFDEGPAAGATVQPTIVFQPIPNGISLPPPPAPPTPASTWVSVTPIPPGSQVEPPCPLPPPVTTRPPSVVRPPQIITPAHNPAQMRGRIAFVRPVTPPPPVTVLPDPMPIPLGGAPMPVQMPVQVVNDPGDPADGS